MLVALVVLSGATRLRPAAAAGPATGEGQVVGHLGSITVTASSLRPGPSDALTGTLRLTTTATASDQLDAALAAGRAAVGVYHQQVSVGEISDLASCDGDSAIPAHGGGLAALRAAGRTRPRLRAVSTGERHPDGRRLKHLAGEEPGDHLLLRPCRPVTLDVPVRGA